ncbi:RZPF34 [Scenedesmus sp. PABB004]|nr:RZPF34 [Scenedesmus sp. PABB004]
MAADEEHYVSASSGDEHEHDTTAAAAAAASGAAAAGVMQHGCEHYRRRCKLVAPCCGEVFWCRHCHNVAKDDSEQDPAKRHTLDRKLVAEVVCALCGVRQPVAAGCAACGAAFGRYACLKCNFWDDTVAKQQFHCDECGICRVGGRANFFHCATCNCCYSVSLRGSHVCVSNSMHQNCPVCVEFLFDSIRPIAVLACGHTIHQECHRDLMAHNTITCPLCLKCILGPDDQARMWRYLDQQVADTPMPEEYRHVRVSVLCNDCGHRGEAAFHVVGHKCSGCGGYNTRRVGAAAGAEAGGGGGGVPQPGQPPAPPAPPQG